MTELPYDVLGGKTLPEVHNWMLERIASMSRLFDQVFAEGISFRSKTGYNGVEGSDVVGAADEALQADFLKYFLNKEEGFEGWGLIAEEDGLYIGATLETPWGLLEVTLDPVDGTWQLKRIVDDADSPREGVSTMLAIRLDGQVIASYIFDLFTKELFFVNPGVHAPVMRQVGEVAEPVSLTTDLLIDMNQGVLAVHGGIGEHPQLNEWLNAAEAAGKPVFAQRTKVKYSVGLALLQVVQGRAVAMARRPGGFFTPWDDSPLIRLCQAASIHTFWIKPGGVFEEFVLEPPTQGAQREFGVLYLPARFVRQLQQIADVRLLAS